MFLSLIFVTALAAKLSSATVGLDWSFPNAESGSRLIQDVTFPFDLSRAPQKEGFYFAQQFFFDNDEEGGYTGLQPRPNNASGSVIRAVFSSFIDGSTSKSPLCHDKADGGPGVSCAVEFNGDYSHKYECAVETTNGGNTWQGTVVNTDTGEWHTIGEWTLPNKAAGIKPRSGGFVEYYNYPFDRDDREICNVLPPTKISFFSPSSNTNGAGEGALGRPYEYGVCEGRSAFSTWGISDGYSVKTGFRGQDGGYWSPW